MPRGKYHISRVAAIILAVKFIRGKVTAGCSTLLHEARCIQHFSPQQQPDFPAVCSAHISVLKKLTC